MTTITLQQIQLLQYTRANKVLKKQLVKFTYSGGFAAYTFSQKERHKCWPRGKTYLRMQRREMNPNINFSVGPRHPDRYAHMKNRMWS